MALVRVMAILQSPTNLATDRFVNTWHFSSASQLPLTSDTATNICDALDDFYAAVDPYIRTELTRLDYRVYDLGDPEPREPTLVAPNTQPSGLGAAFPFEVAACLSFYSLRNLPRRRGRIYLGPLTGAAADNAPATGEPIPGEDFINDVLDGWEAMNANVKSSGGDGAAAPVVFSPTSLAAQELSVHPISHTWMDNAFDTQRSRGGHPTARVVRGPHF
jgi:hypothetical protein